MNLVGAVRSNSRLARGLHVVQLLNANGHRTFGQLRSDLAISAASLSRLLRELQDLGYVTAAGDPVGYQLGSAAAWLQAPQPAYSAPIAALGAAATSLLPGVAAHIQQSLALFIRDDQNIRCLVKSQHENGMVMQQVGDTRQLHDDYPWAWCLLERPLPASGYHLAVLEDRLKIAVPVVPGLAALGSTIAGTRKRQVRNVALGMQRGAQQLAAVARPT